MSREEAVARQKERTKQREEDDMARFLEHGYREHWEHRNSDTARCLVLRKKYPEFAKKWEERKVRVAREERDAKYNNYLAETAEYRALHKTKEGRSTDRYRDLCKRHPHEDIWGIEAVRKVREAIIRREKLKQELEQAERSVAYFKAELVERTSDFNAEEFGRIIEQEIFRN